MKTIWKFPIRITTEQTVQMPFGARVLSAQMQAGQLCLWAEVDSELQPWPRKVFVFGTGHKVDLSSASADTAYVGTVQMMGGEVGHVYVETA